MIFANLIASCLLACGVATSGVRDNHDQKEVLDTPKYAYHTNDVFGGYVLRGYNDSTYTFLDDDFATTYANDFIEIEIVIDDNDYSPVFATIMADYDHYDDGTMASTSFLPMINEFCLTNTFHLSYDGANRFVEMYILYQDNLYYNVSISLDFVVNDTYDDLRQSHLSNNYDINYFAINFINYYSLTNAQRDLFDRIFTNDITDNVYFTIFNGWYHFADNLPVLATNTYFNIIGNNLYQNKLYNCLYFRSENTLVYTSWLADYYINYGYDGIGISVNKVNGTNILFTNCFMTKTSYNTLSYIGVFGFIPDVTDYTLTDLFTGIADTPIQFVTGLFSFELFGTTFSVAFLGIVTVLAIVFIVKKVI